MAGEEPRDRDALERAQLAVAAVERARRSMAASVLPHLDTIDQARRTMAASALPHLEHLEQARRTMATSTLPHLEHLERARRTMATSALPHLEHLEQARRSMRVHAVPHLEAFDQGAMALQAAARRPGVLAALEALDQAPVDPAPDAVAPAWQDVVGSISGALDERTVRRAQEAFRDARTPEAEASATEQPNAGPRLDRIPLNVQLTLFNVSLEVFTKLGDLVEDAGVGQLPLAYVHALQLFFLLASALVLVVSAESDRNN